MKLPPVTKPSKPLADRKYLTSDVVMKLLCYKDAATFFQAVRMQRIPHLKINERRYLFEEEELTKWINDRSAA